MVERSEKIGPIRNEPTKIITDQQKRIVKTQLNRVAVELDPFN